MNRVSAINLDFDAINRSTPLDEKVVFKSAVEIRADLERKEPEDSEPNEGTEESSETDFSRRSTPFAL